MWIASFTRLESQWGSQSINFTSCQSDIICSLIGVFRNAEHWFPEAVCPCKEIRIPESGKFLLVGQPGIQPKESGIPLTTGIRNLSSTGKKLIIQNSVSLRDQESTAWNPESKTVLDSFTWGDTGHVPQFVHLYIFLTRQCILCRIRRYFYNYFILFSRDDRYWN